MAVAGLVLSAIGTGIGVYGQMQSNNAAKEAEAQRQKQLTLDSMRQRRDVVRNLLLTRAQAVSTAAQQGATGGSALPGAFGQIAGVAGRSTQGITQNQDIGNSIFAANRKAFDASTISGFGSGLTSLGGVLMNDAGTIQRVGQSGGYF